MLGGVSAGANCWFESCVTDSFGAGLEAAPRRPRDPRRELLPALRRRGAPTAGLPRLVANGFPAGYAADDDAALHFVGTELREVVSATRRCPWIPRRARLRDADRRPACLVRKIAVVTTASGCGGDDSRAASWRRGWRSRSTSSTRSSGAGLDRVDRRRATRSRRADRGDGGVGDRRRRTAARSATSCSATLMSSSGSTSRCAFGSRASCGGRSGGLGRARSSGTGIASPSGTRS